MRQIQYALFLAVTLLAACGRAQTEQGSAVQDLNAQDFNQKIEQLDNEQVLDVRTPEEWATGTLEGADRINIYDADFKEKAAQLDKNKAVMVYCRSGGRSAQAASMLKEMGFTEVYNLKGGITGWQTAGYEVVK